ncbi:MAG TPA: hypothetical protein VNH42_05690, partial [Mariprofundaceae bacterium]|nr:hypothetical protein [Mariprofundaceae bacterium]
MNPRWRWAIAAVSVLFVAALLHVRMDAGHMRKELLPRVAGLTHATIDYDRLSFSFVHGLDVRLDKVRMRHTAWRIDAPAVLLELRVIPLLLGKIELAGIYLRSPVIRIAPAEEKEATSVETHGLPQGLMLDQLSVSDASIINDTGQVLISGLDMDLRDIGPSRMMRWELQARTGEQMASGHGQLGLRLGTIDNGFGKLTLERIPLQALRDIPRISGLTDHLSRHGYRQLSTVITLNISHADQWTTFSETTLSGDPGRPDIKLRGKLYRDAGHSLAWKDTFVQVGAGPMLAAEGGCSTAGICSSVIRGKSVDLAPFAAVSAPTTPVWQPVSGNMSVQAEMHWQRHDWSLTGQADMRDLTWKDAAGTFILPDFRLDNLLASAKGDAVSLESARIGFVKRSGNMLADGHYDGRGGQGQLHLRFNALQDAWAPVLRLTSMIDPTGALPVGGRGVLQGDAKLVIADGRPDLRFSLDATGAEIGIAGAHKPAGIAAVASGDWQPGADDAHLVVTTATLGASTLKGLLWQRRGGRRTLDISGINLDMQALGKQGVSLPDVLRGFQGSIAGNLATAWDAPAPAGQPQDLWPGMPGLTAQLDLGRFGTDGWQLQGHVAFDHGSAALQRLMLTGAYGNTELDGNVSFAGRNGRVDIRRGTLIWNSGQAIPAWLTSMRLRGRIRDMNVSWLGQHWDKVDARYRLDKAHLSVPELKAGIADGNVSARDLAFDFKPGSLALRGVAQIGALHVQKITGLADMLQGELTGKSFATIRFDGTLPFANWQDWRGNGDLIIYVGHWRPQPLNGVTQSVHHFDVFGLHFHGFKEHVSIGN